jgi:hypothetical protein
MTYFVRKFWSWHTRAMGGHASQPAWTARQEFYYPSTAAADGWLATIIAASRLWLRDGVRTAVNLGLPNTLGGRLPMPNRRLSRDGGSLIWLNLSLSRSRQTPGCEGQDHESHFCIHVQTPCSEPTATSEGSTRRAGAFLIDCRLSPWGERLALDRVPAITRIPCVVATRTFTHFIGIF